MALEYVEYAPAAPGFEDNAMLWSTHRPTAVRRAQDWTAEGEHAFRVVERTVTVTDWRPSPDPDEAAYESAVSQRDRDYLDRLIHDKKWQ